MRDYRSALQGRPIDATRCQRSDGPNGGENQDGARGDRACRRDKLAYAWPAKNKANQPELPRVIQASDSQHQPTAKPRAPVEARAYGA